jgi:hypothetical protein
MGGIRQNVVAVALAASVFSAAAHADDPSGLLARLPSFARMEAGAITPGAVTVHDSGNALSQLNGADNATLLERAPARDAFAFTLSYALTPWMSLDFAHGMLHARHEADGNPVYASTRVFDQAGATLHYARGWNASLFVNFFKMDTLSQDEGVHASSASFVNARVNHDLSRNVRLSFDVLNVFDKHVAGIDPLVSSRLWTEPLVAENVLFDASESRGFRLRLRWTF